MHEATCGQFSTNLKTVIVVQRINSSVNKLVEFPVILNSLVHNVVNATSTPMVWRVGSNG